MSYVDLHIHTTASDGTDSVEELLTHLHQKHIHTFSITDHDTIDHSDIVVPENMHYMTGIECSCSTKYRKCHILGYGFDIHHPSILSLIQLGQDLRSKKLESRLEYLKNTHHIVLSQEDISYLRQLKSGGKPHLARILMKYGYGDNISDAIITYINGCYIEDDSIDATNAIQAIKEAGGIPVWAHPLGGEGSKHLKKDLFEQQFFHLLHLGIEGLECYYSRYSLEEVSFLKSYADTYQLLISGGSDYHGSNKNIELGTLNSEDKDIDTNKLTILHRIG